MLPGRLEARVEWRQRSTEGGPVGLNDLEAVEPPELLQQPLLPLAHQPAAERAALAQGVAQQVTVGVAQDLPALRVGLRAAPSRRTCRA